MKVGTAKPIRKRKVKLKKRPSFTSGFGNQNGDNNNGGGGNGGDNFPDKMESEETNPQSNNKSRVMMVFLLVVVLMTFGGLISAYVVISTNNALEWKPFDLLDWNSSAGLLIQICVSTAIILASSLAYHIARNALLKDQNVKSKKWFLITTVLGGIFIASQMLVWMQLYGRGYYMSGNPYAGFFYILTAVHAIHVLGGIISLGYIILRTWNQTRNDWEIEKRKNDAIAIGWYWHTMDGLWLILVLLLGFYK